MNAPARQTNSNYSQTGEVVLMSQSKRKARPDFNFEPVAPVGKNASRDLLTMAGILVATTTAIMLITEFYSVIEFLK